MLYSYSFLDYQEYSV